MEKPNLTQSKSCVAIPCFRDSAPTHILEIPQRASPFGFLDFRLFWIGLLFVVLETWWLRDDPKGLSDGETKQQSCYSSRHDIKRNKYLTRNQALKTMENSYLVIG